jgi:hypothetical protein
MRNDDLGDGEYRTKEWKDLPRNELLEVRDQIGFIMTDDLRIVLI